ncbi:hypothetical protein [Legionella drancourtii]|uniref:hypothetical protein n=1 Tax=Legionella drancourtii TaxID=168933 RepID=UPI000590FDE5|nr:hypothetical protein [Legionella drancourtii]
MKIRFMLMNAVAVSAIVLTGCNTTDIKATMGNGDAVSTTTNGFFRIFGPIKQWYDILGQI